MSDIIFHIDVNSAFLSWSAVEQLKHNSDLDLRTIPSIIGNTSGRSVVLAKSVPAKPYGIVTGEPVAAAIKKCPQLTIEPPSHQLYSRYSKQLMALLSGYTSDIEQLSIDECFMNYSPIAHRFHSPLDGARTIQEDVYNQLGFTVNIGISTNKILAKVASDFQKPNRIHTLFPEEIETKMWPLPIRNLYSVGKSSATKLEQLGIRTIGDLATADRTILTAHFKRHGQQMWEYANGIGKAKVDGTKREAKGVGNSTTLKEDLTDDVAAKQVLLSLSETVSRRLRHAEQLAGSVAIEIKYSNFEVVSRQTAFDHPTNSTTMIHQYAVRLFDELWNRTPIRLLGIRTGKLISTDEPVQMTIFDLADTTATDETPSFHDTQAKQQQLDQALDAIRKRFGNSAVQRGSLLTKDDEKE